MMVTTVKISFGIQDGGKTDAERIRNVEKQLVTNFDFTLQSAHYFITHFFH